MEMITRTRKPATRAVSLMLDGDFIDKAIECVKYAKRSILICAYDWRWYSNEPASKMQEFNKIVFQKNKAGLDVRAVLDKPEQIRHLLEYGIDSRRYPTERIMHTKAILIDEKLLLIGSHNLTKRGTGNNFEMSVLVDDSAVGLDFLDYFNKMWRNFAE